MRGYIPGRFGLKSFDVVHIEHSSTPGGPGIQTFLIICADDNVNITDVYDDFLQCHYLEYVPSNLPICQLVDWPANFQIALHNLQIYRNLSNLQNMAADFIARHNKLITL